MVMWTAGRRRALCRPAFCWIGRLQPSARALCERTSGRLALCQVGHHTLTFYLCMTITIHDYYGTMCCGHTILHWTYVMLNLPVLWPWAFFFFGVDAKLQCRTIRPAIFSFHSQCSIPTSWCQQPGVNWKSARRTDDSSPRRPLHEN